MPASSFAGVNIRIEMDVVTASAPTWERQVYTTARHIPGSDTDVIQVMGVGQGLLTVRLELDASEWTALQAQLGLTGAFVIAGGAMGDALLEALATPMVTDDGWVIVQASFRKTAAG